MIVGFSGALGAGKTLSAVRWAWRYSLAAGGANIYANMKLNKSHFSRHREINPNFKLGLIDTADDIITMTEDGGGILVLDEVHRLLDARLAMATKNIFLSELFMFFRKMGATTFVTFQTPRLIDIRLRHTIDLYVQCLARGTGRAKVFQQEIYDYQQDPAALVKTDQQLQDHVEGFFGAYDTLEFIHSFDFPKTTRDFDRYMLKVEKASKISRGLIKGGVDDDDADHQQDAS